MRYKRIASLLLILALIILISPFQGGVDAAVSGARSGSTVTVTVSIGSTKNIANFQFNVNYDASVLEYTGVSTPTALSISGRQKSPGLVGVVAYNTSSGDVSANTLARLTFTIKSTSKSSTSISVSGFIGSDSKKVRYTVPNGSATVNIAPPPTTAKPTPRPTSTPTPQPTRPPATPTPTPRPTQRATPTPRPTQPTTVRTTYMTQPPTTQPPTTVPVTSATSLPTETQPLPTISTQWRTPSGGTLRAAEALPAGLTIPAGYGDLQEQTLQGQTVLAAQPAESADARLLYLLTDSDDATNFYFRDDVTNTFQPFVELTLPTASYTVVPAPADAEAPEGYIIGQLELNEQTVSAWLPGPTLQQAEVIPPPILYLRQPSGDEGFHYVLVAEQLVFPVQALGQIPVRDDLQPVPQTEPSSEATEETAAPLPPQVPVETEPPALFGFRHWPLATLAASILALILGLALVIQLIRRRQQAYHPDDFFADEMPPVEKAPDVSIRAPQIAERAVPPDKTDTQQPEPAAPEQPVERDDGEL